MGTEVASEHAVRKLGELAAFRRNGVCVSPDKSRMLFRSGFIVPCNRSFVLKE